MIFSDSFESSDVLTPGDNVQARLTSMEATGGVLFINGVINCPERLRYESDKPLSLIGFGAGISGFFFDRNSGGLSVEVEREFQTGAMKFEGFGIYTDKFFDNAGFYFSSFNRFGPTQSSVIRDMTCATLPGRWRRGGAFSTGFHLNEMPHVRMDHCYAYGPGEGNALYLTGDCTPGPVCTDFQAFYWGKAVTKSAEGKTEGTRLHSSQLVNNQYGVYWASDPGRPGLQIDGGHISSVEGNVVLEGADQSSVRNMLFYRRPGSEGDFYDVDAKDCTTVNVANNQAAINRGGDTAIIRARNVSDLKHNGNNIQQDARTRVIKNG